MIVPMAAYAQFGYSYPPASQLLVGSGGAGAGGSATSPGGGSSAPLSPGGSGVATGTLSPGGSHASTPAAPCCDTPRPIITDPVSGQTVCSCQYDSARLALTSYPRLSTAAAVYGAPYPSTDQNPYPSIGVDSSAFYSPLRSWNVCGAGAAGAGRRQFEGASSGSMGVSSARPLLSLSETDLTEMRYTQITNPPIRVVRDRLAVTDTRLVYTYFIVFE